MIVIGVDVHMHSLTAVAVDEVGRALAELTAASTDGGLTNPEPNRFGSSPIQPHGLR